MFFLLQSLSPCARFNLIQEDGNVAPARYKNMRIILKKSAQILVASFIIPHFPRVSQQGFWKKFSCEWESLSQLGKNKPRC